MKKIDLREFHPTILDRLKYGFGGILGVMLVSLYGIWFGYWENAKEGILFAQSHPVLYTFICLWSFIFGLVAFLLSLFVFILSVGSYD